MPRPGTEKLTQKSNIYCPIRRILPRRQLQIMKTVNPNNFSPPSQHHRTIWTTTDFHHHSFPVIIGRNSQVLPLTITWPDQLHPPLHAELFVCTRLNNIDRPSVLKIFRWVVSRASASPEKPESRKTRKPSAGHDRWPTWTGLLSGGKPSK